MTVKAAGYGRVSTDEQASDGYGLGAQEDSIRSYCEAQRWELVEFYVDAGRSGKSVEGREQLTRMLADAEAGRFQYLVFWKIDRLARNLHELLTICRRLNDVGVGIISINERVDMGTPAGRMMLSMVGSVAQFEREITVERIEVSLAEKARQGELLGPLPLGYLRDESGIVVVDQAIAPLLREMFAMYSLGDRSLRGITKWAAQAGLRSVNGKPLDRMSVRKLLTNPTYAGKVTFHARGGGGVVSQGKHPAIVEPELFDAVQKAFVRRRYKRPERPYGKEAYPLSTVATCDQCGLGLCGSASVKQGVYRYRYYRCSTAHRQGRAACAQPMVQADLLEDQVGAYVGGMRLPPEYLGEVMDELRSRNDARTTDAPEAEQARRRLDRWRKLFAWGEIDEETFKRETRPLREVLDRADHPAETLDIEEAMGYLRRVGELWSTSPRAQQREFVREVFERIVVKGHEVTAITPRGVYAPLFFVDRRERFGDKGSNSCNMAPRAGFEPTT